MRGAPFPAPPCRTARGIIPARAGSTGDERQHLRCDGDHPRSCGEHCRARSRRRPLLGSSPLVRGALTPDEAAELAERIIPARAGSTFSSPFRATDRGDHPRSCGEHGRAGALFRCALGSSPLVRGARRAALGDLYDAGIIPARAGSTARLVRDNHSRRDHPRSCGEHQAMHFPALTNSGSSPLVRGALLRDCGRDDRAGIIPARAGSTCNRPPVAEALRDHPRSCGEHT